MNLPISAANVHRLTQIGQAACGFITDAAWSPDGRTLAVAHGGGIWLWHDGFGGAPTLRLEGHTAPVKGAAFSPDSRVIATASADTTVRLWDATTGQPLDILCGHADSVNAVAFHANGRLLASAGGDRRVLLTDLDSSASTSFEGHTGEITSVVFGGDALASGGWDSTLRLWDVVSMRERAVIALDDWIRDLAASPDAQTLAAACKDGTITLVAFATGELLRAIQAHERALMRGADCVAFSPDGSLLATGGRDNAIKLWELASPSDEPLATLEGHTKPVLTLAFHPAGNLLVSASGDNTIRLWAVGKDNQ